MRLIRVPLRISFVGGGSDLPTHYETYGGSVVSAAIDKYIYITAKRNVSLFPHRYRLVYSQVEKCLTPNEIRHPIIKRLVNEYAIDSLDLDIMSDVPAGTGLGSSSAFTVGLHRALGRLDISTHMLAEFACTTEILNLKEPIGKQDQYAAAFGGINRFGFSKERVLVSRLGICCHDVRAFREHLHLVYVGGTRSASKQLASQSPPDKAEILQTLSILADAFYEDLVNLDFESLGHLIQKGWDLKKRLSPNVSNPTIDKIIETALDSGADGGKLLGAGGAGFVLLYCPLDKKNAMKKALKDIGYSTTPFNFSMEGCKVLYAD